MTEQLGNAEWVTPESGGNVGALVGPPCRAPADEVAGALVPHICESTPHLPIASVRGQHSAHGGG